MLKKAFLTVALAETQNSGTPHPPEENTEIYKQGYPHSESKLLQPRAQHAVIHHLTNTEIRKDKSVNC